MKLFKVWINVPSFYNHSDRDERDALRKACEEEVLNLISELQGASRQDEHSWIYLMSEHALLELLVKLPCVSDYSDKVGICKTECIMNGMGVQASVDAMVQRLELAASRLTEHMFNQKTQSPIAGPHLLSVTQVEIYEDFCTHALQDKLDEGWRIIAVCPQEARRPDYVLGRSQL